MSLSSIANFIGDYTFHKIFKMILNPWCIYFILDFLGQLTVDLHESRTAFSVNFKLTFKGTGFEASSPNKACEINDKTPSSLGPIHLLMTSVDGSGKAGLSPS